MVMFEKLDSFTFGKLFDMLDQRTQIRLSACCKYLLESRSKITEIHATSTMCDKQLQLLNNVKILHCHKNNLLTNDGICNLPLEILHKGLNKKITSDGIKNIKTLREITFNDLDEYGINEDIFIGRTITKTKIKNYSGVFDKIKIIICA